MKTTSMMSCENQLGKKWMMLKRARLMSLAAAGALAFALAWRASPVQAAPLAILTDVRGQVQLFRGGRPQNAKSGALLQAGDMVRVSKGAATVYYVTRAPQSLGAGQQVRVAAAGAAGTRPSLWRNVYAGISSGFARKSKTTGGSVRNPDAPVKVKLVSPVFTHVLQARPTFVWTKIPDAVDYVLTMRDASGIVMWTLTVNGYSVDYPASAPALVPGKKYDWTVVPRLTEAGGQFAEDAERGTAAATFYIASPVVVRAAIVENDQLRRALRRSPDSTRRVAQAAAMARRGFRSEAIALLVPETLAPLTVAAGASLQVLDTVRPALDESTRTLLRSLYLDTNQTALAHDLEAMSSPAITPVVSAAP